MTDLPADPPEDQLVDDSDEDHTDPIATDEEAAAAAAAALRRATRSTSPAKARRPPRPKPASYTNDRDPQPLGSAIERLVRDQGWEDQSAVAVLMSEWAQIVGTDLAEHVQPVTFDEGVLTVQATDDLAVSRLRIFEDQQYI